LQVTQDQVERLIVEFKQGHGIRCVLMGHDIVKSVIRQQAPEQLQREMVIIYQ
jgi:hypothetical protein